MYLQIVIINESSYRHKTSQETATMKPWHNNITRSQTYKIHQS